jgi:23S rRNA-/tRNA-specific pseudouridylate synthase
MSVARRIWADRHESLAELIERAAPDERVALDEGRVFVRGDRAEIDTELERGEVVEVWAARERGARQLGILLDAGDLVIVDKPAGLPSEPDHHGTWSVRSELETVLSERAGRRVSVHVVSRLDAAVSGVMVVATSESGRARLTHAQAEGRLERRYVAIAAGRLEGSGTWTGPVDETPRTRARGRGGATHVTRRRGGSRWLTRASARPCSRSRP